MLHETLSRTNENQPKSEEKTRNHRPEQKKNEYTEVQSESEPPAVAGGLTLCSQNSIKSNQPHLKPPAVAGVSDHHSHTLIALENIKIVRADVLEFLSNLEDESIDLIATDPAYSGMNQHLQLGRGRIVGRYAEKASSGKWFDEFHDTVENYGKFLAECARVLKNNRHIYIMFDSYSLLTLAPLVREYFDVKNLITWDKVNIGMGHYFRRRHEFIVFAGKGKKPVNARNIPDVWRIKRVMPVRYPTQKPVEIFDAMMTASAEKDYLVCDPFVGSGSSALAALKHGCRFTGCDLSKKAVDVTKERIERFYQDKIDFLQPKSMLVKNGSGDENYGWLKS